MTFWEYFNQICELKAQKKIINILLNPGIEEIEHVFL